MRGSLALILLLAVCVCMLHTANALLPGGREPLTGYTQAAPLPGEGGSVYAAGERRYIPVTEGVTLDRGVLQVSGMLLMPERAVSRVRTRAALLPLAVTANGEERADELLMMKTQMIRREEAADWNADDHCGFAATVARCLVPDGRYAVMLADEAEGERIVMDTGVRVTLTESGMDVQSAEETRHREAVTGP